MWPDSVFISMNLVDKGIRMLIDSWSVIFPTDIKIRVPMAIIYNGRGIDPTTMKRIPDWMKTLPHLQHIFQEREFEPNTIVYDKKYWNTVFLTTMERYEIMRLMVMIPKHTMDELAEVRAKITSITDEQAEIERLTDALYDLDRKHKKLISDSDLFQKRYDNLKNALDSISKKRYDLDNQVRELEEKNRKLSMAPERLKEGIELALSRITKDVPYGGGDYITPDTVKFLERLINKWC